MLTEIWRENFGRRRSFISLKLCLCGEHRFLFIYSVYLVSLKKEKNVCKFSKNLASTKNEFCYIKGLLFNIVDFDV